MFDFINEEYLAKRKFNSLDEYSGLSMADIFCDLILKNNRIAGADFYSVCRRFNHRFVDDYLEIRFPDYSIAVYKIGVGNDILISKVFGANSKFFDSLFE